MASHPAPFAARLGGREKCALGDVFDLAKFGVNLTRLAPGAMSALRHAHTKQDEFIYILEGHPTLYTGRSAIDRPAIMQAIPTTICRPPGRREVAVPA